MRMRVAAVLCGLATLVAADASMAAIEEYPLPFDFRAQALGPLDITAGPDGAMWFTQFSRKRIGRIDTSGVFSEFRLPPGSGPVAITGGPDHDLWFTTGALNPLEDPAGSYIARLATTGVVDEIVPLVDSNGGLPTMLGGIALGADGNLWFAELSPGQVGRITTDGLLTEFGAVHPLGSTVQTVVPGPDGALWISGPEALGRVSSNGAISSVPVPASGQGGSPVSSGLAVGPDGALWITRYRFPAEVNQPYTDAAVVRVTTDGKATAYPLPDAAAQPGSIAPGPDGALWFTQAGANSIGRITTTGAIDQFPLPTAASGPGDIAAGPDGAMWFTEDRAPGSPDAVGRIATSALSDGHSALGSCQQVPGDGDGPGAVCSGRTLAPIARGSAVVSLATRGGVHAVGRAVVLERRWRVRLRQRVPLRRGRRYALRLEVRGHRRHHARHVVNLRLRPARRRPERRVRAVGPAQPPRLERSRSIASVRRSSGTVSEIRKKPSPFGP